MKHKVIQLNKNEFTQLKRGGKVEYYYDGLRIEVRGPTKEVKNEKKPQTSVR